jgi:hypothetical protein
MHLDDLSVVKLKNPHRENKDTFSEYIGRTFVKLSSHDPSVAMIHAAHLSNKT